LLPHGTLIAQMSSEQIESIKTPIFGNKLILKWESNRELKENLLYNFSRFFSHIRIVFRPSSFAPFITCSAQCDPRVATDVKFTLIIRNVFFMNVR